MRASKRQNAQRNDACRCFKEVHSLVLGALYEMNRRPSANSFCLDVLESEISVVEKENPTQDGGRNCHLVEVQAAEELEI